MEDDLFRYYESVDLLRLSAWEERKLLSLVRSSSAILVARVSCIPTVHLFPFISSSEDETGFTFDETEFTFDDPSTGFSETRDQTSETRDYTSETRDYTSDTRDYTSSTD